MQTMWYRSLTPCLLVVQVSKGTVDEGIYALAQRKLRLDAAVMGALTTGKPTLSLL